MVKAHFWRRVKGRYRRTSARMFFRRPLVIKTKDPIISFTFDDFPRSALHTGGAILKRYGAKGTYYASLGLMGKQAPTGTMFVREDLETLSQEGHELGCHTFGHCDAGETQPRAFEASIVQNQQALSALCPGVFFRTLSYPIHEPRPLTKRKAEQHFVCCRGGGQTFNVGTADLNYLSSHFLEQSRDNPQAVRDLIDENRRARGWLIFSTHDILEVPTPWGCTPDFFEDIVRCAVNSGAKILPIVQAWEVLSCHPNCNSQSKGA
jgi:peptidoglycan/xylan/chitin deacetylase (PgdA/CDA1 family)